MLSKTLTSVCDRRASRKPDSQFREAFMLKFFTPNTTISIIALVGGLTVTACSTTNGDSRYGGQSDECCVQTECNVQSECGYWVVPVNHYMTVEKEKIVTVEKELPPVVIEKHAPCPSDTTPDANGACIRVVERIVDRVVELPCTQHCYPPPPPPCPTCLPHKK
jgi:hypothetical protein